MVNGHSATFYDVLVVLLLFLAVCGGILLVYLIRNKGYINLARTLYDSIFLYKIVIKMYRLQEHREDLREDKSGAFAYKLASSVCDFLENYVIIEDKEKHVMANKIVAKICVTLRFFPTKEEKELIEKKLREELLLKPLNPNRLN